MRTRLRRGTPPHLHQGQTPRADTDCVCSWTRPVTGVKKRCDRHQASSIKEYIFQIVIVHRIRMPVFLKERSYRSGSYSSCSSKVIHGDIFAKARVSLRTKRFDNLRNCSRQINAQKEKSDREENC